MDPKVFLAALGLPEGATVDQVTEFAVARAAAEKSLAKLHEAIGATGNEAVIAVGVLRDNTEVLAKTREELTALKAQIETDKAKAEADEKSRIISSLVAEGKASAGNEEEMGWLQAKSLDDLRMHAKFAKPVIPGTPNAAPREADPTALALTDREKAEAKELNMSEADYLQAKKDAQAKYS